MFYILISNVVVTISIRIILKIIPPTKRNKNLNRFLVRLVIERTKKYEIQKENYMARSYL
jgi:hypothetical protein